MKNLTIQTSIPSANLTDFASSLNGTANNLTDVTSNLTDVTSNLTDVASSLADVTRGNINLGKNPKVSKIVENRQVSPNQEIDSTIILRYQSFHKKNMVAAADNATVMGEIAQQAVSFTKFGGQVETDDTDFTGNLGISTVGGLLNINARLKTLKVHKENYAAATDEETKAFYKERIKEDLAFITKEGGMGLKKLVKVDLIWK